MSELISTTMPSKSSTQIFVDEDGRPLKFRVQSSLDPRVRHDLERCITRHGGTVISNVPLRGFVVVDPTSLSGRALIKAWTWDERPARRFVTATYVKRCIDVNALLPVEEDRMPRIALTQKTNVGGSNDYIRPPLSDEQKLKLAHYLSGIQVENRNSNGTFKKLVDQTAKYPWVNSLPWQSFRNDYCKNRHSYDKKIKEISKRKHQASKDKFIDFTKSNTRKTVCPIQTVKHINFNSVQKLSKSSLKGTNVPTFSTETSASTAVEPIDVDDMRSFSLLDSATSGTGQGDSEALLQQINSPRDHEPGPPMSLEPITGSESLPPLFRDDNDEAFPETLAKETNFTIEEVKQRLAGFSGDQQGAKDFLMQCRRMVDDLFLQSFTGPTSISQA
ncbi:hypothetical protein SCHPADRAFT_49729 [Schizopora paradoxa]|uniref:Uncharacterized protein n=1 Tax=Schizopora paradoxa TaxID=27342 RepID=A0A0H2SRA3_9AGAM|nr:hypothetical protein SCHPADRAFT_49729 [Schizopora paradoxa]